MSCGCKCLSKYETWVEDILEIFGYNFEKQIRFVDLTGIGNKRLSYDFGVYNNDELIALIECQGQQHYRPVKHFGGEAQFEVQQMHDELKREYAEAYLKVPLIEIPYTVSEYDEIIDVLKQYI